MSVRVRKNGFVLVNRHWICGPNVVFETLLYLCNHIYIYAYTYLSLSLSHSRPSVRDIAWTEHLFCDSSDFSGDPSDSTTKRKKNNNQGSGVSAILENWLDPRPRPGNCSKFEEYLLLDNPELWLKRVVVSSWISMGPQKILFNHKNSAQAISRTGDTYSPKVSNKTLRPSLPYNHLSGHAQTFPAG